MENENVRKRDSNECVLSSKSSCSQNNEISFRPPLNGHKFVPRVNKHEALVQPSLR